MKNVNIFLLFFGLLFFGCSKNTKPEHTVQAVLTDCMPDRKDVGILNDQEGTVTLIADKFVIVPSDPSMRFGPCNLSESFRVEKTKVRFSVVLKEIFPNERWIASPCYLTKIDKLND